jgi:Glycosyl transferase family 2
MDQIGGSRGLNLNGKNASFPIEINQEIRHPCLGFRSIFPPLSVFQYNDGYPLKDATTPPASSGRDFLEPLGIAKLSSRQFDWILPSVFWLPGWNFSSVRAEHLPFCFWLVDAARPRLIVDLVTGRPDTYLAFCQTADRLDYGAQCLGITDIFDRRGSGDAGSPLREYHDTHFVHLSYLTEEARQLVGPLRARAIDLLHIDGQQASTFSQNEARAWLNQLSPQGLILVDRPEFLGAVWQELLEKRVSFTISGKSNLQLSSADATHSSQLASLFSATGDTDVTTLMRNVFVRLGSALREEALHRDLVSFATRLEISLADQSATADLLREENTKLEIEAQRQASDRAGLIARIATLEPFVENFRGEVIRLQEHAIQVEKEIRTLERLVNDRDLQISLLGDHAQSLTRESEAEISRMRQLVANRENELRDAIEHARLQREAADHREAELNITLQQSLSELRRHAVHLETDLADITQSTAWKATAPFRLFFLNFPKVARVLRRALKLLWWTASLQLFSRLREFRHSRRHTTKVLDRALTAHTSDPTSATSRIDSPAHLRLGVSPQALPLSAAIEHNSEQVRLQNIENRIVQLTSIVDLERHRIDFALLGADGLLNEIELYHEARAQTDYKKAFTENTPLVSICVATMNRPDLLIERCLKSLLSQSYRNIQINVVGDHCTDDTGSRIAGLRDDRIMFRNLPSRGPYPPPGIDRWRVAGTNAFNAALSMCEGQFITHLDDDDCASADRIETLVNAAQEHKADFCWHSFWNERQDGTWFLLGDGRFELGQITTGSIFYHHYFKKIPWDVFAYRTQEPGDWNRLRKIRSLRPGLHFVDRPLMFHYTEGSQPPFVRLNGESFLE